MKKFFIVDYDYFSTNNILSASQIGFRSGASTEHDLFKFTDDILKCFDDKKFAIATFIDLSQAFECVDHDILLIKIKRYGVHSTRLRWISSYISNMQGSLCILEPDPINIIKFKCWCSTWINF